MGEVYDKLMEFVGFDAIQVYGDTGSSKTRFALQAKEEFVEQGKKVIYIDSERNLLKKPDGCDYKYFADFQEMVDFICGVKGGGKKADTPPGLEAGYDLVIVDSMGAPALGAFTQAPLNEKGTILMGCQALSYELKKYCLRNKATALVLNQPESEFGKGPYHVRAPFGDKAQFYYKELWYSRIMATKEDKTTCKVESYRSRFTGRKSPLFEINVTNKGTTVEWIGDKAKVDDDQSKPFWEEEGDAK